MNRTFSILLILSIIVSGCKEEVVPLHLDEMSISEGDLDMCDDTPCPEVAINYTVATGDETIASAINEQIVETVCATLYLGEDDPPKGQTIQQAMEAFILGYQEDKEEFPDLDSEYTARINVVESYVSDDLISLLANQFMYTGGAHGYSSNYYLNLDRKTGEALSHDELFKDIDEFSQFAENWFRNTFGIQAEDTINATGFSFENETFHLPDAIGLTKNYIVLWYNPYDIAPYSQGPVEVLIPIKEAASYLAIQ